jgi:hypothetical protein
MRDLGLKLVSALDVAIAAVAIVWLAVMGQWLWIAGLVLLLDGLVGGVLLSAWIIGVQNSPRSGVYK